MATTAKPTGMVLAPATVMAPVLATEMPVDMAMVREASSVAIHPTAMDVPTPATTMAIGPTHTATAIAAPTITTPIGRTITTTTTDTGRTATTTIPIARTTAADITSLVWACTVRA